MGEDVVVLLLLEELVGEDLVVVTEKLTHCRTYTQTCRPIRSDRFIPVEFFAREKKE